MMNVGWNPQKLFANLLRSCKSLGGYTINSSSVGLKLFILYIHCSDYSLLIVFTSRPDIVKFNIAIN